MAGAKLMDKPALPKRFYKAVAVEQNDEGWQIMLDGRQARTPGRHFLQSSSKALADAISEEWDAQEEEVDPYKMPLSRRRMIVLDRAETDLEKWREIMLAYLGSDLLCYRAEQPQELVQRQQTTWQPYLDWFASLTGVALATTSGVMAVSQPDSAIRKVQELYSGANADTTSCLAAATEITGSAVLGLALWKNQRSAEDIFSASRLDETFQAEKWGTDSEAVERERKLREDFLSVARYLTLVQETD